MPNGRWALAAAAQSGAWWRCEFDFEAIRWRCKRAQEIEGEKQAAAASRADAERLEAQAALRGSSAQQQAEKQQQQQQQFLRRLLMPDSSVEDGFEFCEGGGAATTAFPAKCAGACDSRRRSH